MGTKIQSERGLGVSEVVTGLGVLMAACFLAGMAYYAVKLDGPAAPCSAPAADRGVEGRDG